RDPAARHVMDALQSGAVQAVVDEACRAEWLAVLEYPELALPDEARKAAAAAFDGCALLLRDAPSRTDIRLPRCADPDDQKFLELALSAGAQWLLSKDKEVLRLARRTAREGWFQIVTPAAWIPPV
ncbi:MAG: PIN domain-containing protein, partial [Dyella sp.]|nr:PIN domain-containing protein [Dyella sp.]